MRKLLEDYIQKNNITLKKDTIDKLYTYLELIYKKNKIINLTGTKEKEEIARRHFLDCVSIFTLDQFEPLKLKGKKILDIGTGAGLPGMLFSILLPESKIFLLDKSMKKTDFLKEIIVALELNNTKVITGRAEELSRKKPHRENFDIVTARAVTKFNILLELTIPFCNINGKIIFYKSKKVFEEIEEHVEAISRLGGEFEKLVTAEVPDLEGFRAFLILNKEKRTPLKYPRNFAHIKKNPL